MIRRAYIFGLCSLFLLAAAPASMAGAGPQRPAPITPRNDSSGLVTLAGNTRPEANAENDRGPVADNFPMEHMMLQLRRSLLQERALEQFINQLHDPKSPNYHQWLTALKFGEKYGLAPQDLTRITNWLESCGFQVNLVYPSRVLIDFSGTAGQVRQAFHTEIHHLLVKGVEHYANMTDPKIPAGLAPVIVGVVSLNDFRPRPMSHPRSNYTFISGGYYYWAVVPADLATIYNLNPIFAAGYTGQGQTIVVIEDTDVYNTADWTTFRSVLGLSGYTSGSFTQVHPPPPSGPNNCTPPGVNGDDGEAILDAEWASAAAPSAAIELASCTNTSNFGGFIALENLLNASGTPPAIVSISYGESEPYLGSAANAYISGLYQQAVTEGVSVFVSAGDQGAAVSDPAVSAATHGIAISGFASTPYNVSVGGTDFGDVYAGTYSTYWGESNGPTYGSALSYIPEIPWNDSCGSTLIATYIGYGATYGSAGFCNSSPGSHFLDTWAGSGGPSGCATGTTSPPGSGVVSGTCAGYAKPSWQSVYGNPSDGVRDTPDVSLFAADGVWSHYYVVCYSDLTYSGSAECVGSPQNWSGFGGTSISSPIWAGFQALINQVTGSRQGNPNPTYYSLAATEYGASGNASCNSTLGNGVGSTCIFYDVTQGDMDVDCTGSYNCYKPSGTYGVLSTSNGAYQPAYGTQTGWDFATGIGTVNAYNLVAALAPPGGVSLSPQILAFPAQTISTTSAAKSVTLSNTGIGSVTLYSFTITGGNSADFTLTQTCGSTLAGGTNCTLNPKFAPTAAGPRKSSISVSDNATGSPHTVVLTGVGTAVSLSPPSLTFGSQGVGTSSSPLVVTVTNKGAVTLHLYQIAILGTNAGDFSKTTACGSTLAAGANCTVSVTFKPTATGARTGSLLFSDDGGASPQGVSLTGTGT